MAVQTPFVDLPTPQQRFRGRLGRKLLLVLLPLVLLPVLLMGAAAYVRARELLEQQAVSQLIVFQAKERQVLDDWVRVKHVRLDSLTRRPSFTDPATFLLDFDRTRRGFSSERAALIEELRSINLSANEALFNQFMLVNSEGRVIVSTDLRWQSLYIGNTSFFLEHIQRSSTISEVLVPPSWLYQNQIILLTVQPYPREGEQPHGYLVGISESVALQRILESNLSFLPNSFAYFVTLEGQFIGRDRLGDLVSLPPTPQQMELLGAQNMSEQPLNFAYDSFNSQPALGAYSWVPSVNSSLVVEVPRALVFSEINSLAPFTLGLVSITSIIFLIIVYLSARRVTRPLVRMTEASRNFAEGDWQSRAPVERNDEIGLLGFTFNQMADELAELYRSLEFQVRERTQQIVTASEVAHLATSAKTLDELLNLTVNLIVERFGYYQSAIFLVDEARENVILREASGAVGRSLKAQNFQISLQASSIVGWVARTNQPRIATDVHADPMHLKHELLPETHSEVGIPISIGEQVLGVLDVQSKNYDDFSPQVVEVLLTLANQLASAIQNYRLLEGTAVNLQELNQLYRSSRQIAQATTEQEIFQAANVAVQQSPYISAVYLPAGERMVLVQSQVGASYANLLPPVLNISSKIARTYFGGTGALIVRDVNQPATPIHSELLLMPQRLACLTAALLPILFEGQLAGMIILASRERGTLTQTSVQPYASLVELSATALQKVSALQTTQDSLAEIQSLNTFSQAIAKENELYKLYGLVHQQIRNTIGDVYFYIALYDPRTDYVEIPYLYEGGDITKLDPFPMGEGLTSIVLRTRQPLMLVEDTERRAAALGAKVIGESAKSWLGVPLMVGGEAFGVISVQDTKQERRFDEDHLRLLGTLASQMAGVLNSARLLKESQRRALQLQTASEIARDATGTLERDELLNRAVNLIRERFNFYHAAVFLLDPAREFAVVQSSTGEAGRQMMASGHRLAVGSKSIIGHVTAAGEPLIVNDVSQDPTHRFNPLLPETRSEVGIPLKERGRVLGALDVQSTQPYAFTPGDVEILQILTDQLAAAVANAELFAETEQHLAQHRLIHHVTSVAASSTRMEDTLSSAVQGLRVTLGDRVAILLVDVEKNLLRVAASAGYEDDVLGLQIPMGKGITGWVAEHREPLLVNDVLSDPRYIAGDQNVRSELAAPLIYRGELLGVLNVESDVPGAFDEHDQDIMGTLATSLAAILVNTRLSERQRQLFEVTNKIRRSANMETILQTTASELSRALNTRRTRIQVSVEKGTAAADETGNGAENGQETNT